MNFRSKLWIVAWVPFACSSPKRAFSDQDNDSTSTNSDESVENTTQSASSESNGKTTTASSDTRDHDTADVTWSAPTDETGETRDATNEGSDTAPCVERGAEECFNGVDDDCNGLTDCGDPACAPDATCEPNGENPGVIVAHDAECPPGYTESTIELHQGLVGEPCTGCSCAVDVPTECVGDLYLYESDGECLADDDLNGGIAVDAPVTFECPNEPLVDGFTWGYRVEAVRLVPGTGTCAPSGTPSLGPVSWQQSYKYCVTDTVGVGCQFGFACVPKQQTGKACFELLRGECPDDLLRQVFFEDYEDERTCTCECEGEGDCNDVGIRMGSDWSCGIEEHPVTPAGEKDCETTPYSPPASLLGTPKAPACTPRGNISGGLTPAKPRTLCCEG